MADFTASTTFRDMLADLAAASLYYFITLHGVAGSGLADGDVYSAGIDGELATGNGYTQGGSEIDLTHTGGTGGVLDAADKVWPATGGDIGPASYYAIWVNTTQTITGAKCCFIKDKSGSPQTATTGNDMTAAVTNMVTIPTPS